MNNLSTGALTYMWIFALAASILLGYWAARVGVRNGRSFGLCFLLGFLLGLIGVLIVYVIGPVRDAGRAPYRTRDTGIPTREPGEKRLKVCQHCEKLIPYEAAYCQYCGADISSEDTGS
jgi:hypothetical protein